MKTQLYEEKEMYCDRCHGETYEVLDVEEGQALIACVWCGHNAHWVWTKKKSKMKSPGVFKFKSGRFSGLSVEEVSKKEGGDRYLMFLLQKSHSDRVKEEIQKHYNNAVVAVGDTIDAEPTQA